MKIDTLFKFSIPPVKKMYKTIISNLINLSMSKYNTIIW